MRNKGAGPSRHRAYNGIDDARNGLPLCKNHHAAFEKLHRVLRAHRADHHVFDERDQRDRVIEELGVEFFANQLHRGAGKNALMRDDAEQVEALALQTAPRKVGDVIHLLAEHFVEDDANDLDAFFFEQRLV